MMVEIIWGRKGRPDQFEGMGCRGSGPPFEPKGMDRWMYGCVLWVRCSIKAGAPPFIQRHPRLRLISGQTPDPITERCCEDKHTITLASNQQQPLGPLFYRRQPTIAQCRRPRFHKASRARLARSQAKLFKSMAAAWVASICSSCCIGAAKLLVGLHPSHSPRRRPPCTQPPDPACIEKDTLLTVRIASPLTDVCSRGEARGPAAGPDRRLPTVSCRDTPVVLVPLNGSTTGTWQSQLTPVQFFGWTRGVLNDDARWPVALMGWDTGR